MATQTSRRPCTFCTRRDDADTCIRSHRSETGEITHIYAHTRCAKKRGVLPLYVYVDPRTGERR
ncbi:hypothetical protein [Streptomyces sp. CC208A]|uniref:hypothetical protein n=1 Tax=Streptomyces sp. CC208A TaxID=3044573 RepID=UPI0024A8A43D|nr:hypothetical protein [Streptomyces sp. CC208A]